MLPLNTLENAKNKKVVVHTTDQKHYSGSLDSFDIYANIILRDTYTNENKNELLGTCIVPGSIISYLEILE